MGNKFVGSQGRTWQGSPAGVLSPLAHVNYNMGPLVPLGLGQSFGLPAPLGTDYVTKLKSHRPLHPYEQLPKLLENS